jgi:hypothetical protein
MKGTGGLVLPVSHKHLAELCTLRGIRQQGCQQRKQQALAFWSKQAKQQAVVV